MALFSEDAVADLVDDAAEDLSFEIECSDGVLAVPASDAAKVIARCHFFEASFAHGTKESNSRVVQKPDWVMTTARRVLTLFVRESVKIDPFDLSNMMAFVEAMDQLLVSDLIVNAPNTHGDHLVNLTAFVHSLAPRTPPETRYAFCLGALPISGWRSATAAATAHGRSFSELWVEMWRDGIFITEEGGLTVKRASPAADSGNSLRAFDDFVDNLRLPLEVGFGARDRSNDSFIVDTSQPIASSVLHIVTKLRSNGHMSHTQTKKVFNKEALSLRIPVRALGLISREAIQKIEQRTQARGYLHFGSSLGFYLNGGQEACPTFNGTAAQLLAALNIIKGLTNLGLHGPPDSLCRSLRCAFSANADAASCEFEILAGEPAHAGRRHSGECLLCSEIYLRYRGPARAHVGHYSQRHVCFRLAQAHLTQLPEGYLLSAPSESFRAHAAIHELLVPVYLLVRRTLDR